MTRNRRSRNNQELVITLDPKTTLGAFSDTIFTPGKTTSRHECSHCLKGQLKPNRVVYQAYSGGKLWIYIEALDGKVPFSNMDYPPGRFDPESGKSVIISATDAQYISRCGYSDFTDCIYQEVSGEVESLFPLYSQLKNGIKPLKNGQVSAEGEVLVGFFLVSD